MCVGDEWVCVVVWMGGMLICVDMMCVSVLWCGWADVCGGKASVYVCVCVCVCAYVCVCVGLCVYVQAAISIPTQSARAHMHTGIHITKTPTRF